MIDCLRQVTYPIDLGLQKLQFLLEALNAVILDQFDKMGILQRIISKVKEVGRA